MAVSPACWFNFLERHLALAASLCAAGVFYLVGWALPTRGLWRLPSWRVGGRCEVVLNWRTDLASLCAFLQLRNLCVSKNRWPKKTLAIAVLICDNHGRRAWAATR